MAGDFRERVISTDRGWAVQQCICGEQADGHGDTDVLCATLDGDELARWYEDDWQTGSFTAPAGDQYDPRRLGADPYPRQTWTGDGDPDVLSASDLRTTRLRGTRTTDGAGGFGAQQVIISTLADGVQSECLRADVDGDGAIRRALRLWARRARSRGTRTTDGAGSFGAQQVIIDPHQRGRCS